MKTASMDLLDRLPAVRQGLWFSGGCITCHVRIVRHDVLFGSGDDDDPPELARDRHVECYYVRYDLPSFNQRGPRRWRDGGAALSLREAVFLAQRRLGPAVCWED